MRRRAGVCRAEAFTLLEMVLAFTLVAFMIGLIAVNVVEAVRRAKLDEDFSRLARTLRQAADYAAYSGKELAVVIEVTDGCYTVFESSREDSYSEFEQKPIVEQQALTRCYIDEIEHEDGTRQYSGELILKVTPRGWSQSVLLYLLDDHNNLHRFLRCDRYTKHVQQSNTPLELLEPREEVSLTMPL